MSSGDSQSSSAGTLEVEDPVDVEARIAGAATETCPSCDTPGAWSLSRRHRFNPFGGVTCLVLAFWATLAGWLFGLGYIPAAALTIVGVVLVAAQRTALVCQVCGFVKPRG